VHLERKEIKKSTLQGHIAKPYFINSREREREREREELPVGVLGEEKHLQRLLPLHLISHSTQESMKPNCQ
jgi:hypothetical protein